MLHAVIIAGGAGTRFWPASRIAKPKQLLPLGAPDSMLSATARRVEGLVAPEQQYLVVSERHVEASSALAPHIPISQVLGESQGRNTAPAIALAAVHISAIDPDGVMVVLPADHHVINTNAFVKALEVAAAHAQNGEIVTLGIRPDRPATGYGYIERGALLNDGVHRVERFCEKPDETRAEAFLKAGNFEWNAGIFVMKVGVFLQELQRQLPKHHEAFSRYSKAISSPEELSSRKELYAEISGISVDYGIMEGAKNLAVVPVECGWSDVGAWDALHHVGQVDAHNNVAQGQALVLDGDGNHVYASEGSIVCVLGVSDLVVVHTEDATLVMPKDRAQEVRTVVEALKEKKWNEKL